MREKDGYRENLEMLREAFPGRNVLTVEEAATVLACKRRTIIGMIENGKLVAMDLGSGKKRIFRIPITAVARMWVK